MRANDAGSVLPQFQKGLLDAGALQGALLGSAHLACIATDLEGVIRIFNPGAERMLGYGAAEVLNRVTAVNLADPQELSTRAAVLSVETGVQVKPAFEALVCKAARDGEDAFELSFFRKDASSVPLMLSVMALRDGQGAILGYALIGTDMSGRRGADPQRGRPVPRAAGQGKGVVLVVDDDDSAAKVLRLFLEAEGFSVVHAISAEDAVLAGPAQRLDLIILDLQLYGMNGWQFLQHLHKSSALSRVPVIISSGRPVHDLALSRGAAAVLQKPVTRAELNAVLVEIGLLKTPAALSR